MRLKFLLLILTVCSPGLVKSQEANAKVSQFLLSDFVNGVVKQKTGNISLVSMNYNTFYQELIFERNGKRLALVPNLIDTVFIQNRVFVPDSSETIFLESVGNKQVSIFVQHKSRTSKGKDITGYGLTNSRVRNVSGLNSNSGRSTRNIYTQYYDIKLPEDHILVDDTRYWLKKDEKFVELSSFHGIVKLFPEKNEQLKKYIRENSLVFTRKKDTINLISFAFNSFVSL
jgi:hypothetical protein